MIIDKKDIVNKFDLTYKKYEDYNFLMNRVIVSLLLLPSTPLWMIPVQSEGFVSIPFLVVMLEGLAVHFYLTPYLYVKEEGKQVSLFKKLRGLPICSKELERSRVSYLKRFCIKLGTVVFLFQQIGACLDRCWSWINSLAPLVAIVAFYMLGYVDIKLAEKNVE